MPDAARIAQATVLEIPVTIQGSRAVEGTEQRELFTETTKTILTFESGAALHLRSKVTVGQSLFLRNDKSGKEILCRVLEAPRESQSGFTDLEFTVSNPEFWDAPAEEPVAAGQESEAAERIVPASKSPAPSMELSAPAGGEILAASSGDPHSVPPSAAPEATAALPQSTAEAEPSDAKDAEQLAAMMAAEAKGSAKRASTAKQAKQIQPVAASEVERKKDETKSRPPSQPKAFSTLAFRIRGVFEFRRMGTSTVLGITATVLIAAALGVVWRETRGSAIHIGFGTSASSAPKQQPIHIPAPPSQIPATASAAIAKIPDTMKADVAATGKSGAAEHFVAAVPTKSDATESAPRPDAASSGESQPQEPSKPNTPDIVPARIVSQPQPPFPAWAKNLDVSDGVVKLDALIDEKGNLAEAKPLSGPRVLQRAAQEAAGLWLFEPAQSDGKPIATHIVLTIEFQRELEKAP